MKRLLLPLVLVVLSFLASIQAKAWDDKTINQKSLQKICENGAGLNAMFGQQYFAQIFRGRVATGTTTPGDYVGIKRWFRANCPEVPL